MSVFSRKPSAGMVVAMVALCLGIGGSAIAAGGLTKPQVKKIAKKQAKKQINSLAPGLTVANAQHAVSADTATNAQRAVSADSAGRATVGGPAAYASIAANGTVDAGAPSRAITGANVDNPVTGFYCFDLPFAPTTATAMGAIEENLADDGILSYSLNPDDFVECPASAEAEVANIDASDSLLQNDGFNIQFDG
jgi:hypothetical protein